MSVKKDEKETPAPLDALEASSGPRAKGAGDGLQLLVAQFKQRAQGLEADEVESEITRLLEKLIDQHAKVVPAALRAEHRQLLRTMLQEDPTLLAMQEDLRRAAKKL